MTQKGSNLGREGFPPAEKLLVSQERNSVWGQEMLYLFHGIDGENSKEIRAREREDHLAYLHAHEDVLVLAGGTLPDGEGPATGSVYLLNVANRAAAEDFLKAEPFYKAGLFGQTHLTRMRKGHWHPERAPKTAEGD